MNEIAIMVAFYSSSCIRHNGGYLRHKLMCECWFEKLESTANFTDITNGIHKIFSGY